MFSALYTAGSKLYAAGVLLDSSVGGKNIKISSTATESTQGIIDILTKVGQVAGAVILAFAIVKMIMAYAEENGQAKMNASIMFGTSAFLLTLSTIIKTKGSGFAESGVSANGTTKIMFAKTMLDLLETILKYAGGAMLCFGAFMFIMSYLHENPDQHSKATTTIMVATGFLATDQIVSAIKKHLSGGDIWKTDDTTINNLLSTAISALAGIAQVGGAVLTVYGIFSILFAFREDDAAKKSNAMKLIAVGAALVSPKTIMMFF